MSLQSNRFSFVLLTSNHDIGLRVQCTKPIKILVLQCVVAEWSGRSVTVRVRVRARARAKEWDFSLLLFSLH